MINIPKKFPATPAGAGRQHAALLRAYMRAYHGGGQFGYDTRTMAVQEPALFAYLTRLEREGPKLPVRYRYWRGVKYVASGTPAPAHFARCGCCGRAWDDTRSSAWTPAPAGRCPFEYWHRSKES